MGKPLSEMTLEELWALFPIILTEPDPRWEALYAREESLLRSVLPGTAAIHHIGSTAIRGIWAKPIIDILVEAGAGGDLARYDEPLARAGYRCMSRGEDRRSYNKGYTESGFAPEVFHLHLTRPGEQPELLFRDYLNAHREDAKAYEALKLSLWKPYEHNRDGYTDAKSAFVQQILRRAREESDGDER